MHKIITTNITNKIINKNNSSACDSSGQGCTAS